MRRNLCVWVYVCMCACVLGLGLGLVRVRVRVGDRVKGWYLTASCCCSFFPMRTPVLSNLDDNGRRGSEVSCYGWMCMYVCMYVYLYVCMYVCVCVYCMYVCMCAYVCACVCACVSVCMSGSVGGLVTARGRGCMCGLVMPVVLPRRVLDGPQSCNQQNLQVTLPQLQYRPVPVQVL